MLRENCERIKNDLEQKIVLLEGPRQCEKTTLSKQIYPNSAYVNYPLIHGRVVHSI